MLKKLIKYDLKYGAKIVIVIHALLWIAAIFGRVFFLDRIDFDAVSYTHLDVYKRQDLI